ncbi:MAG: transcription antitermination factor NusB [Burkholderiaceae bacterium]
MTTPSTESSPAPGQPPAKARPPRKPGTRSARSRAREFALQALYQHLVGGNAVDSIAEYTRELLGFDKADAAHFDALLRGCVQGAAQLDAQLLPLLDRPFSGISPVEHSILWIGAYEYQHCPEVPWRVVLNECIELAKEFGGTDGHKYINAVLNGLALRLRPAEVGKDRAAARPRPAAK